jgi:pimeloyl-ACP methyl ester carboxylesterase
VNPFRAGWGALGNFPRFRRLSRKSLPPLDFRPDQPGPILDFVPGWRSAAGVGEPLLRGLGAALEAAALTFAPFDPQPRGLAPKAAELRARWRAFPFDQGRHLVVIGHSFGGLIAARALLDATRDGAFDRGREVVLVTINSPFGGPRWGLGTAGRLLSFLLDGRAGDPELGDMDRRSSGLKALREQLRAAPFPVLSVSSRDDEFVARASACVGSTHLSDPHWTCHTGPLVRPEQRASLVENLASRPELRF